MSALRPSIDGQHADQCLPILLRLQGMRRCAPPQSWRLLCVLLVRRRALSSDSGGARVGINSQLLCLIAPGDEHLSAAQVLSREELVSDLVQRSAMVAGVGAGAGAGATMHTLDTVILRRWSIAASIVAFCATGTATASGSAITLLDHCGAYSVRRFDPSRFEMGESVPLRRCRPGSGSPSSEDTQQRSGKRSGREGTPIAMKFSCSVRRTSAGRTQTERRCVGTARK